MTTAVKGIADKVSLGRPKTIADSVNTIISVELPATLEGRYAGLRDMSIETIGTFKVFVRSKPDGTMNVNSLTSISDKLMKLFPIKGEVSISTKPSEHFLGFDGYGFHVSQIMFDLRTLININN